MAKSESQFVTVDGHRIKLTHLDKVLYPETGTTKGDILDYYARVAHVLLPHSADRPATRKRWVNGVGTAKNPGEMFFQKDLGDSYPGWLRHRSIQHKDHVNEYPLVNDLATLTWLGQIAALEIHVPQWRFGRTGTQKNPDRLVLDLDPGEGIGLAECAEVARFARSILTDMGLDPMPVTSGSKGIHLYAALDGKQDSDAVSAVAHELARALEADHPDLVVSDMKRSIRSGKVLVDWSQNNANKTTITPYSLRGRAHPMVAAPRTWRELSSPTLEHLDYRQVLERVKRRGDPLADLTAGHLAALEPTREHMATFQSSPDAEERLAKYRSMRDSSKTREPMGSGAGGPDGATFVIQEHHARRLHYDFRLEHEGVLVSWAIPKGVPTDAKQNHLAVQTEDHPLEYGTFEGTIPAGEYGGGEVTIWDAGTYELEKWREGDEVIAVLHGEKHGTHKYALIHTGGEGKAANNWLIHLMVDKPGHSTAGHASHSPRAATTRSAAATAPEKVARTRTVVGSGHKRGRVQAPSPMLATLGTENEIDPDDGWAFEMKWDGIRAVGTVSQGTVSLTSRNDKDLTATYPELLALADSVEGDAVLDGEIVALNSVGRPDFGLLQTRMNLTRPSDVEAARKRAPVQYLLFDILELDGESLVKRSYDERRSALESAVRSRGPIQVPPAFDGELDAAMESSRKLGLEGVMAKRRDDAYVSGRRTRSWIKLKHHRTQEVVIGGWRPGKGSRQDTVGSLLLGIPTEEGLRYVGRVGTGFADRDLADLKRRFSSLSRKTTPLIGVPALDARDAQWVRPSLVGEVEFSEWTPTGRLRQPSWRGWRTDKDAAQVVTE
jgi:bifunctional non-homologous end joining protein LigD